MTTFKAMAADLDQDPRAQRRRELPDRDPMARRLRMQDSRGRLSDTVADIESDVVAALGLGQFSLLYQPRMALDTGDVVAVEALLRWQDSARGLLGPKAFLPLVAQTSAMVALGQWVLYEASREAARWELERPAGVRPVMVSVNVAALEVLEPAFFDGVQLILEEHALPTTQLQLEIDASDPLRGETVVTTRLGLLRDEGVRVAIDGACPQLGSGSLHLDADSIHLHRRWTREHRQRRRPRRGGGGSGRAHPPLRRHGLRDGRRDASPSGRAVGGRLRPGPGLLLLRPRSLRPHRLARQLSRDQRGRSPSIVTRCSTRCCVTEVAHADVEGRPVVPRHHVAGRPAVPVRQLGRRRQRRRGARGSRRSRPVGGRPGAS